MRYHCPFLYLFLCPVLVFSAEINDTVYIQNDYQVDSLIRVVVARSFPLLKDEEIIVKHLEQDGYFFQSNMEIKSLFKRDRTYVIQVNPAIYKLQCPIDAIESILAHELTHSYDYLTHGFGKIMWQMVGKKKIYHYERATDMNAIKLGYGEGLLIYKNWLYPQLTPKQLGVKKKRYLTPEETKSAIQSQQD